MLPRSAIAPPEHRHPPLRIHEEQPKEPGKQPPALEILLKGRRAVGVNYLSSTQIERVVLKKTTVGMKRELNRRNIDGHPQCNAVATDEAERVQGNPQFPAPSR